MKQTRRADFDARYGITKDMLDEEGRYKIPKVAVKSPAIFFSEDYSGYSWLELQILKLYHIPLKVFQYFFPRYDIGKLIEIYHAK